MNNRALAFHGLAIKRHADAAAVAGLVGLPEQTVAAELAAALASGRVMEARGSYTLMPLARVVLEAGYDRDFAHLRADPAFRTAYEGFERVNPDLKQLITDWQTMDFHGEKRANDHSDPDYDARILDRLGTLHERSEPVFAGLARGLPRLRIYFDKLEEALEKAEDGDNAWVSDIHRESYHTVWFELHEELLRIMGTEREE
jgi:hypothetical protein